MTERYIPHTYDGESKPTPTIETTTQRMICPEHTPNQLMVRRYLESIDEKTLRDIYVELAGKTGRDTEAVDFIPLEDILIADISDANYDGHYTWGNRQIVLNSYTLADNPIATLHSLIHEELHAVANNSERYTTRDGIEVQESRIGISRYTTKEAPDDASYRILVNDEYNYTEADEGITEMIAEKIMREYLTRTGDHDMYDRGRTEQHLEHALHEHSYGTYQKTVTIFTSIVSALANIPEDVVRQSIIRTYFRSDQILPDEVIDALELRLPGLCDKLLALLSTTNPRTDWYKIATTIGASPHFTSEEKSIVLDAAITLNEEKIAYLNSTLKETDEDNRP